MERGTSLIELLVGLALLALLGSMGAYSWGLREALRPLSSVAEELLYELDSLARIARSSNREIQVAFKPSEKRALITLEPNSKLQEISFGAEVYLFSPRFGNLLEDRSVLILRPSGTASPGSLTLTGKDGNSCKVTQSLRGLRRVTCR